MNTGMKIYTLHRWFLFLVLLVVSITQWTAIRLIHLKCLSNVEVVTTHTETQIWHSAFIGAPCKKYVVTMEGDENQFKSNCRCCNSFVTYKCRSGELICITFLPYWWSTLELYPEKFDPENSTFGGLPEQ